MGRLATVLLSALRSGPFTAFEIASHVGEPLEAVVRQLSSLVAAGHVEIVGLVARPTAKRRLSLYGLPSNRSVFQSSWPPSPTESHVGG